MLTAKVQAASLPTHVGKESTHEGHLAHIAQEHALLGCDSLLECDIN